MLNRTIRTRLVAISSVGLLALGVMASSSHDRASGVTSHASASAELPVLPNGVFGWD